MNDIDRDQIIRKNHSSVRRINDLNGDNEIALDVDGNNITIDETLIQAEYDAQAYARNRASEYPALAEQLDEIFHNGIDSWKAVIKVTKDKYPK